MTVAEENQIVTRKEFVTFRNFSKYHGKHVYFLKQAGKQIGRDNVFFAMFIAWHFN